MNCNTIIMQGCADRDKKGNQMKKMSHKIIAILLASIMVFFVLAGCGGNLGYIPEKINPPQSNNENDNHIDTGYEEDQTQPHTPPEDDDDSDTGDLPESTALDTSSPEAFIDGVLEIYHVIMEDVDGSLQGENGKARMEEIETTLTMYSPAFIREMVSLYKDIGADFIIRVLDDSNEPYGTASWYPDEDLIITLNFDEDEDEDDDFHSTLSHELGHAMHYLIENSMDEDQDEYGLESLNQGFEYVENYIDEWDYELHSPVFAWAYGMYNYHEDWATIVEVLTIITPGGITDELPDISERLIDPKNEPLFEKSRYIREMVYKYISDECSAIFKVLYEAEDNLRAAA